VIVVAKGLGEHSAKLRPVRRFIFAISRSANGFDSVDPTTLSETKLNFCVMFVNCGPPKRGPPADLYCPVVHN